MKLKNLFTAVAVVHAALIAPLAHGQEPNGGGATVRFQVFDSTGDMLFRVMQEKFCAKYNLKCEALRIASGPAGIQALLGDSLQVSFITTDAAVRAITGGAKVRIIHGIADRIPFYVVARNGMATPDASKGYPAVMKDFKGSTVGVTARGAGTELIMRLLLRGAGMSVNDVTFVAVGGPPTAIGSLRSGQIDSAVEVPPTAEICDHSSVCKTILDLPASTNIPIVNSLAGTGVVALMKQQYIEQHPQVVKAWLAAAQEASAWMKTPANFEDYLALGEKYVRLGIPHAHEILRESLQRQLRISSVGVKPAAVKAYVDVLYQAGLVSRKLPVDQLVSKLAPQP